jgi:hypothetical protein
MSETEDYQCEGTPVPRVSCLAESVLALLLGKVHTYTYNDFVAIDQNSDAEQEDGAVQ